MNNVELSQNGSWYQIEVEYDNQWNVFKAHGKMELECLVDDLIHDIKLDAEFYGRTEWLELADKLKGMK